MDGSCDNAPAAFEQGLFDMWSQRTADEAHAVLVKLDVEVSNQSDKDVKKGKGREGWGG